ncbi:MAG: ABC transporter substrate-binding protein [Acidimicrobiales bacterium]
MSLRPLAMTAIVAVALTAAACSEPLPKHAATPTTTSSRNGAPPLEAGDGSVVSRSAGRPWSMGTVPAHATAADPSATPVKVGFMNIDSGPIGATPELHQATDAAVAFINAELGGVDGHPIELVPCETDLGVDKAQACAHLMVTEHVVAVLDGLNLSAGAATKVLEQNDIAWVGGIPLDPAEMTSPIAFQFSGGAPGAFTAFADDAAHRLRAKKVAVLYANVSQISEAAVDYGIAPLRRAGVDVTEISFDLTTQDYAAIVQRAAESSPDAILVGAADFACPKVMQAIADMRLTDTTVYMVGSCADHKWIAQVGADKVADTIFNIESLIVRPGPFSADNDLYTGAIAKYGTGVNAKGAATIAFRSTLNLYSVLRDLGPDATASKVIAAFRAARNRPSFDGHAYTCDGRQVPALPSLCAPQQVLAKVGGPTGEDFTQVSDGWIDIPKLVATK